MSTAVQFRGGTSAEHKAFTGAAREITVDTTANTLVVHDGVTPGGHPLLPVNQSVFQKADYNTVGFIKTGPQSLSLKAGTTIMVAGVLLRTVSDLPVSMPVLAGGSDYAVFMNPDGTAQAVADPYNAPAEAPQVGSRKVGGFHYGLVAPGTTMASGSFSSGPVTGAGGSMAWFQPDVDKLAGINEFSLWDLAWRCKGEQRGMTYDPVSQIWVGIYFMGTSPDIDGPSCYNTAVASGTVLPIIPAAWGGNGVLRYTALRSWEANEMVTAYGLRLIRYEEFVSTMFGVTEGISLGGAASTIPATARQPGYTSRIGVEQATGHQWAFGGPIISSHGTAYAANGRGSWYGSTSLVLLGGGRGDAADSGSRAASFGNALSSSYWLCSVRAVGDHLSPVGAAR